MSIESNKQVIRRHLQAVNEKTPEVWDEIMAPSYDANFPGVPSGREGYAQIVKQMWTAFPDLNVTVEDMLADDEKVVVRYTERGTQHADFLGIHTKGGSYEKKGICIYRLENGQMAEHWVQEDSLGWVHQLGVALPTEALSFT